MQVKWLSCFVAWFLLALTGCSTSTPVTQQQPAAVSSSPPPATDPGHEALNEQAAIAAQERAIAAKYGNDRQAAMKDPQMQQLMAKMNSLQR